jgi:four helix bundle protein
MLRSFKELLVWQKGYELCLVVYKTTRAFPSDERFGLTSQLRRAAMSIPCNIAEGYERHSTKDYIRFLRMACGSVGEVETQLMLCRDLGYGDAPTLGDLLERTAELERMLKALIRSLQRKPDN